MRKIWDYISIRTNFTLSTKQVMATMVSMLGVFHSCLLFFFLIFDIMPLVFLNFCSVALYILCGLWVYQGRNPRKIFNIIYIEILINATISSIVVGTESGFVLYLVALTPIAYYAVYHFGTETKQINPMFYIGLSVIAFCITRIVCMNTEPLYGYGNDTVEKIVYMVNYFVTIVAIIGFFSTLLNQIKTLEAVRERQNRKLERLSQTDSLTGMVNRRSIQDKYRQAVNLGESYSVIMGDIDNFKKINDSYGHETGDTVLKSVAAAFKNNVRENDSVCRWGGEEILVFLPKCEKEGASAIAQRILEQIRRITIEQSGEMVTITMGVAFSGEAVSFDDIVRKADERLYMGKRNGKNQVVSESMPRTEK